MLHSVLTDQLPEPVSIILKEQIRGMDQLFHLSEKLNLKIICKPSCFSINYLPMNSLFVGTQVLCLYQSLSNSLYLHLSQLPLFPRPLPKFLDFGRKDCTFSCLVQQNNSYLTTAESRHNHEL